MKKHDGLSDTQELPIPPEMKMQSSQEYGNHTLLNGSAGTTNGADAPLVPAQRTPVRYSDPNAYHKSAGNEYHQPYNPQERPSYQRELPRNATKTYQQPKTHRIKNDTQEYRKPKKKKRRRHRSSCLRKLVLSFVSFCLTIFLLYSILVMSAIRKLEYRETGERNLVVNLSDYDKDIRNILLIGTDSRDGEIGRADTIMILSFSKHNKTYTISSILRDSYVSIPGHATNKLNAAYAYGGPTLLMDTIVNNYGIPLDDYICINFKAFVNITDALGGLKLEVSDREAEEINVILQSEVNAIMGDDPLDDFLPSGGTFILNGKQALAYARIRHIGNADFERTERQRTVLDSIITSMKVKAPTAITKMMKNALPELSTNMTTKDLYLLSLKVPVDLVLYDMQMLRLPADGTFTDQTSPDGQMVLAVNFDVNHQLYVDAMHNQITDEVTGQPDNPS